MGFTIPNAVSVNIGADTVTVTVPQGMDLTSLTPTITVSAKAAVNPASGTPRNFSSTVTYTVIAENGSTADWTVTVQGVLLTSMQGIEAYLDNASAPVPLPVNIDLASDWTTLLDAIRTANKEVALDLSECTMSGMEFDPVASDTDPDRVAAKNKIVSLILPDTAKSIAAGNYSNPTFENFSALTSVTGKYVETIGNYAFQYCNALKTVTLPAALTIDRGTFSSCTSLTAVSLPLATYIKANAFEDTGITALTVTLGAAVPKLDPDLFNSISGAKIVTVKVPSGATGYASTLPATFTGTLTAGGPHWGEGFRGNGWTGSSAYVTSAINENISLTIKEEGTP
jgi:hypothetical protein